MASESSEIPDIDELDGILSSLKTENSILEGATQEIEKILSIITGFSQGSMSHFATGINIDFGTNIDSILSSLRENIGDLQNNIDDFFEPIEPILSSFQEQTDSIQEQIEVIGDFSEEISNVVQDVLIAKTDEIESAIHSLSEDHQSSLEEKSNWVNQKIEEIINRLIDSLLENITPQFEEMASFYLRVIANANSHIETINQQIEDSIGVTLDKLQGSSKNLPSVSQA